MNYLTLVTVGSITLIVFALPGCLLYQLYRSGSPIQETIMIGVPIGIGISSLVFAIAGWVAGVNVYYFFLVFVTASVGLSLVVAQRKHYHSDNYKLIPTNGFDKTVIYFILLISITITLSYISFGKATPSGYLYKDLYATDLLHHMSVFIQLIKGIPPTNPYYIDQPWHYYWLSHTFPAFMYELSGKTIDPKSIMLLTSLIYSILFISVLSLLVKHKFEDKKVFVVVMVIGLVAFGYNDVFILAKFLLTNVSESVVTQLHLNQLISEKGEQYTGYSHSWFRSFLVEPHTTLALSLLFITLLLVQREGKTQTDGRRVVFKGVLLGLIFSIDAFIGTISIIWYSFMLTYISWKNKIHVRSAIKHLILLSMPVVTVFILLVALKIIPIGESTLIIKPYVKMMLLSPIYFVIDYGPISILSIYGIYLLIKKKITLEIQFVVLAFISMFFMFFVNLADIGSTQMFRKAGLVLRIPLLMLSGISLNYIMAKNSYKLKSILAAAIILAIPTPIIDVYKLSDWRTAKSFLTYSDYEACKWIKSNLPENSVIQDFPSGITKLLAFAERRVALGDWEHAKSGGIKPSALHDRFSDIKKIFESEDIELTLSLLKKYSIEYIYLSDSDIEKFKVPSLKYDIYKERFEKIYSKNGVLIYKLVKN